MADDENGERTEVQLASVELDARQYRSRGPDHQWDLIGSVNFTETEVPTSCGIIKLTINQATLRLDFDGCEMPQGDAGYVRHAPETREFAVKETVESQGTMGGKAGAGFKLSLSRGAGASAEAEGKVAKEKKTDRKETVEFSEIRNLVTFSKKEPGTNSVEWIIANVDEKQGLIGAIIHERDSQGGRLGTLKSRTKGGWLVQPIVQFEPHAEIVDPQQLTVATNVKAAAAKAVNQKELGRKLGIVSALLGQEMDHVALDPLVMPEDDSEQ